MTDKFEALKALADEIAPGYRQEWAFERNADTGFADVGVFNESGDWTPFIQVSISDYSGDSMHDAKLAEFLTLATPPVISELLAALEELNTKLFDQSILLDAAISRAEAAEQREDNLKSMFDVVSAKNAELEQRLQQPIKLRKCDIGIACEFISEHVVVSLAAVMVEAATAGFKVEVEGE